METRPYRFRSVVLEGLEIAGRHFTLIEEAVDPAQLVPWEGTYNWRFVEQSIPQFLIQKLARQISGVKATDVLLSAGRLQEVGILYRVLDEIGDDILFIALGIVTANWTNTHDDYVSYFWSESNESGPPYRRKSIRAYINRAFEQDDPISADKVDHSLYSSYSDFVHVRSHPIMGLIAGPPPRFDLNPIFDDAAVGQFANHQPTYVGLSP